MTQIIPITQARENFTKLVDKADKTFEEYIITVNGKPAAVLMSAQEHESWKETMDVLSNKTLVRAIKKGENELSAGKGIPFEEIEKELNV